MTRREKLEHARLHGALLILVAGGHLIAGVKGVAVAGLVVLALVIWKDLIWDDD